MENPNSLNSTETNDDQLESRDDFNGTTDNKALNMSASDVRRRIEDIRERIDFLAEDDLLDEYDLAF